VVEKVHNKIVHVMGENQPAKPSVQISNLPLSASIYPMNFQKSIHNGKKKLGFCFEFLFLWAGSYMFLKF
jgi:hypothetical protein